MTQAEALAILKIGANVFLTGEPGSGKTHVVNQYVSYLRSGGVEPAVTASTGIAATHIGGLTIHSWSGIGVRRALTKSDLQHMTQNSTVARRVGNAHVLIIDEVSMLAAHTLAMVDTVCRTVRRSPKPFGGLRVVLVGDFFQLPPVTPTGEQTVSRQSSLLTENSSDEFAYQSPAWQALNPVVCYLTEQHRQEDRIFLELLSGIRTAQVAAQHWALLRTRYAPKPKGTVTQLYSHNTDVDAINNEELAKLSGQQHLFDMHSRGPAKLVASLKRGCLSPATLALKISARVMFTKNDVTRRRYVNGTLGTITGFAKENGGYPVVKTRAGATILAEPEEWRLEDGGRVLASITQVPLRLAWALTVHKSQGLSLDAAHMDLSRTFAYGQGYVALSRVRTLAGLTLAGCNDRALEVHPGVRVQDETFRIRSEAARQKLASFEMKELAARQAAFIRDCGGKPGSERRVTPAKIRVSTYETTRELLQHKQSFADIARERGLTESTIISHVETLLTENKLDRKSDLAHIPRPEKFSEMKQALETVRKQEGRMLLAPARALLNDSCSYDELRLARLFIV